MPRFAEAVDAAGLIFVGPSADTIRAMGDKAAARAAAQAAGVPIVPGSDGEVADLDQALAEAARIGFPVMLKASAGGGGRGIRVATMQRNSTATSIPRKPKRRRHSATVRFISSVSSIAPGISKCRCSATASASCIASNANARCSGDARKIWEEAPSPALDDHTRQALCASAVRLARKCAIAAPVRWNILYNDRAGEFFFIEMNTRIQVEHPVTEMVTGIDLVREMIRIAQGERLRLQQADIATRGAAIEVRINAEDPDKNFRPRPGRVTR